MKAFKYISIVFIIFFAFLFTRTVLAWVEPFASPTYDPVNSAEKAYYPSVLKIGANDYRMWYQSNSTPSNTTIAYATSTDGLSWTLVTNAVSGLIPDNAGHPHVEFADGKYRIWYWNAVSPYTNDAIHYAESVDGITWTNDSAITGNLISATGGLWNSGSYGAVDVIINNSPTNTGTNPFDYKYAMYYDATSGGYEQIALGYSADGIAWTLYGTGPVLGIGLSDSWDSGYVTFGTVIKNGNGNWEMWYSGGISGSSEGIGYATSTDGLAWTKSITNPFMSKNDGVAWRNNRTYTPSVIKDGNDYKMWFTGKDNATGNYAIGYATLAGPVPPATINVVKVVVGGSKIFSDFPLFVNGSSVTSGVTNNFPAPATYTISETSDPNYSTTFSSFCPNGIVNLVAGNSTICTITNTYIVPSPQGGGDGSLLASLVPPLIDLVKTASPLSLPNGPGPITYTYTLHNIGTVPVAKITLIGDTCSPIILTSGDTNADNKLDVNETWIYKCSTILSSTNTSTVTATGWANGISAIDVASATVVVGIPGLPNTGIIPPLIHVTKIPSPLALPAGGGMVTYTEEITNPGIVALNNVNLIDDRCSPLSYISGDTNNDSKLDTNETWQYTCETNLAKTTTNIAAVSGEANGLTAKDFAIATVVVAVPELPNTGINPSTSITTAPRALRLGSRGVDVSALQTALEQKGFYVSPSIVDEIFGPMTKAAVAQYQTSVELQPDGVFGPLTRVKLISP